jgi:hypothetical protein
MQLKFVVVPTLTALLGLDAPAHAGWVRTYQNESTSAILSDGGVGYTNYAWVRIAILPGVATGSGAARETTCLSEVGPGETSVGSRHPGCETLKGHSLRSEPAGDGPSEIPVRRGMQR